MVALNSPPKISLAPETIKRWTVKDYHRLSELGLLDPDERTELIAGQITVMAAKGTPHVIALQLLALQLDNFLRDESFFARAQDPIELDDLSEPEPDLIVAKGDILAYTAHHPRPSEVSLLVEIADSTLKKDCEVKDKLYAAASIEEYWVVDLKHRKLHIFRQPTANGYSSHLILDETHQVSPSAFPALKISIASILPPAS